MNVYDSNKIQDLMYLSGYVVTDNIREANLVVLNTCHIREKAAEKVYSELGRINKLKQQKQDMLIAVAGCVSQAEGDEIFKRAPYVDIVIGPQSYHNLPAMVVAANTNSTYHGRNRLIELDFIEEAKFDQLPEESHTINTASRFVSVQEGCDKFCTFCVVPYTRGAEFSRPFEQIYREVLNAVINGAKEIVLLGQNVNAYHGLLSNVEINLATLISKIAKIEGIKRIRYTTSHPRDMDDALINIHGNEQKLMPYLHLPIQSGSDQILKSMNRKYTTKYYLEIIDKLRAKRPDILLSSDFIVGFPGETDEDFQATLDIVAQVQYGQCYSFKYSPRPGTPAATKPQVPEHIKNQRLIALQQKILENQLMINKSCIGSIMPVLFDKPGRHEKQMSGKSPYMQSVYIDNASDTLIGNIVDVKITHAFPNSLSGLLI